MPVAPGLVFLHSHSSIPLFAAFFRAQTLRQIRGRVDRIFFLFSFCFSEWHGARDKVLPGAGNDLLIPFDEPDGIRSLPSALIILSGKKSCIGPTPLFPTSPCHRLLRSSTPRKSSPNLTSGSLNRNFRRFSCGGSDP